MPGIDREVAYRLYKFKKIRVFDTGVGARLPEAYKKFFSEWMMTTPQPVHYIPEPGKWKRNPETGEVKPIQNVPLPTRFPLELNNTLLGGELVIQGFQKRKPTRRRVPKFWVPQLHRSVVYSEILDKYISACVTQRLIHLIIKHHGFDNYLLQNKACDLKTLLALKIKREILLTLRDKKLPYDDDTKNDEIYEKYKEYMVPDEEAEWYGLSYKEACAKLMNLERRAHQKVPLKEIYRQELIEELRTADLAKSTEASTGEAASSGWLSRIRNPFSTKKQTV